jgi:lambda family phage portal protein
MSLLNRVIVKVSPSWALNRLSSEIKFNALQAMNYSSSGASGKKNSMRGWFTKSGSPDQDITENQKTLRERSRDAYYSQPLAAAAIKSTSTSVVGTGLRVTPSIEYEYLGIPREKAREFERIIQREWRFYAESTEIDSGRQMDFYQMQHLALLSALMNGDAAALLPYIKDRKGTIYKTAVNLIESDRIDTPPNMGGKVVGGIELDEFGGPKKAYIASRHPSDVFVVGKPIEYKEIDFFDDNGRPNILLIIQYRERIGQRRGQPLLSPIIEGLKQLTRYGDAELMNAVVSSMITTFIETPSPEQPQGFAGNAAPGMDAAAGIAPAGIDGEDSPREVTMGHGAVVELGEGQKAVLANPGRANTAFESYINAFVTHLMASLELPKEVVLKEFKASYSASRGALLEAWKMFNMRRGWLVTEFCQPIYEAWLAEAVAIGRVTAPGFFTDEATRKAWCGALWHGPSQGQLNPVNEMKASKIAVEEGFSTRSKEARQLNNADYFADIEPIRREEEELRRKNKTIFANGAPLEKIETDDDSDD